MGIHHDTMSSKRATQSEQSSELSSTNCAYYLSRTVHENSLTLSTHFDRVAVLQQLLPGLGLITYNYDQRPGQRVQNDDNFWCQGVALFEYDCNADGRGNPNWRLWLEAASHDGTSLGQIVDSNPNP